MTPHSNEIFVKIKISSFKSHNNLAHYSNLTQKSVFLDPLPLNGICMAFPYHFTYCNVIYGQTPFELRSK